MRNFSRIVFMGLVVMCVCLGVTIGTASAQIPGLEKRIQQIEGTLDVGDGSAVYLLPDLVAGQLLTVHAEGTSGNFDPFIGLFDAGISRETISDGFATAVTTAETENSDPLLVIPAYSDETFIVWNDDRANTFDASFSVFVPYDGDYKLLVTSTPLQATFGDYRLLLGVGAPDVVKGEGTPTGEPIAEFIRAGAGTELAVQNLEGQLTSVTTADDYQLTDFFPNDTLYAYVESLTPGFEPRIELKAFGAKAVRNGNYNASGRAGSFAYAMPGGAEKLVLTVTGCCEEEGAVGDYRLLLSRNVPDVLTGSAETHGNPIVREPITVSVGTKLQQITGIDQKAENYSAVYTLRLRWQDPLLAFDPEECQCRLKIYNGDDFAKFAGENEILWPIFTISNQQGNRWSQNKNVVVNYDGSATYFERFSTTLQAPDFDFKRFPFDTQQFFIAVESLLPVTYFEYVTDDFTEIGEQLGEEEWYVVSADLEVGEQQLSTDSITANFELRFEAKRHVIFYLFRIFLPLILIILVAWITFFMEDYGKRVDAASANLLLFIAYNFTVANDLPRLGYLTYLDVLLACTFAVSVLVVVYNVILKRWENEGKRDRSEKVDGYMIWVYPLGYLIAYSAVTIYYFAGAWGILISST
jgi:hypothetical protein